TVPTNLSVDTVTSSLVDLSWTASTDSGGSGLAGYKIERAPDSGGSPGTFAQIDTSGTNSYTDATASASTKYWYRVRAYDNAGNNSNYNDYTTSSPIYAGSGDGFVRSMDASWSTARNASSGDDYNVTTTYNTGHSFFSAGVYQVRRALWPFDTSGIPDGATVDDATFYLRTTDDGGNGDVQHIVSTSLTVIDNINDYAVANWGSTSAGSFPATNTWDTYVSSAVNLATIPMNKTGTTYIGTRSHHDVDDSAPTGLIITNFTLMNKLVHRKTHI
ncbi:hypothetical protein LCGC14_2806390, partial [marine sediment metagenome]